MLVDQAVSSQLLLPSHACLVATMLTAMMVIDSGTVSLKLNAFFYKKCMPWSWGLITAIKKQLRHTLSVLFWQLLQSTTVWAAEKEWKCCPHSSGCQEFEVSASEMAFLLYTPPRSPIWKADCDRASPWRDASANCSPCYTGLCFQFSFLGTRSV